MDRNIPDLWNIFSLTSPPSNANGGPHGGPGAHRGGGGGGGQRRPASSSMGEGIHVNWNQHNQDMLLKWCDRSSACDRPRTYDKFYQKLPGNFHDPQQTDSAISVCSSEEDCGGGGGTTSLSAGDLRGAKDKKRRKTKKGKRPLQYSRTITERDVKQIERHLSMKKTIRKKIMRDLQQAFVEDPKQFTDGGGLMAASSSGQSESAAARKNKDAFNLQDSLNFDPKKAQQTSEQKFLDMLRDSSDDSGHGSPESREARYQKFRSCRERPRRYPPLISDSSSCGDESETQTTESEKDVSHDIIEDIIDIKDLVVSEELYEGGQQKKEKRSFWQILTGKKKKDRIASPPGKEK